jgi:hypothetical protein
MLADVRDSADKRVPALSPQGFKEYVTDDVYMIDDIALERKTDPETGEVYDYTRDPGLMTIAAGVVWNGHGSTMIRICGRGVDPNELLLNLLASATKLIPQGEGMYYASQSDWLLEQWNDMLEWKRLNYEGLDRSACPPHWKGIMDEIEGRTRGMDMKRPDELPVNQKIKDSVTQHALEGIAWYKESLETPVDGDDPPVAPWF